MMLVVAYIGFGNSVTRYHLPYVKVRADKIKVKMIYRRQEDRLGNEAEESYYPDIHFTTNLDEVLNDPEINLIVVNTPDEFHVSYAMKSLEHGKHVLVEKPFAITVEDAKRVFDYAKEKGLMVMCNNNRRYDADFATVKKVIDSGKIGNLVEIESHYDYFRPNGSDPDIRYVYNLGVHPIDQIIYLLGKPEEVRYDVRTLFWPQGTADDYYDLDFFYKGVKAIVKTSFLVKLDYPRFIVHGTKGSFLMPSQGHQSLLAKKPGPVEISFEPAGEELWGTLSYIDEHGQDRTEKVPNEVQDYGKIYDNIYDVIFHGADKIVCDEEVLTVLEIVVEATQVGAQKA